MNIEITEQFIEQCLGYRFLYHYNPYNQTYHCIYRDDMANYWNGWSHKSRVGWTTASSSMEAKIRMVQRMNDLPEDGVCGNDTTTVILKELGAIR